MFRPSDIVVDAFIRRLAEDYTQAFGDGNRTDRDTIVQVARMTLARIARSDALYHDIDHVIITTQVGQDILRGRMVRDGDVSSSDWVHFVCSTLCFAIGFVRGACPGDAGDRCVIDAAGGTLVLPRGANDGRLWPHFTDRSMIFVRHVFRGHAVLDCETLAANIEYSRFPPPADCNHDTATYPGLLRAAHIVGAVADPNFLLKIAPLYLELVQAGLAEQIGYDSVASLRAGYPRFFWQVLYPVIKDGADLLAHTGDGRVWLANMHAQLLVEEHNLPSAMAPAVTPAS